MSNLVLSREVYCPLDQTFAYHTDLTRAPQWWPNLMEMSPVEGGGGAAAVGDRYRWSYNMLGRTFSGEIVVTDAVPGERFAFETTGGIHATFRNEYRATARTRTRITAFINYEVPGILGKALDKLFVERRNAADAEHAMDQLKLHLEAEVMARIDSGVV